MFTLACQGNNTSGTGSGELAPDQTLRYFMVDDVKSLDPAHVEYATDITYLINVHAGLLAFDKDLKIVPQIATALPTVSSDGLTYTFTLRKDVKFSNGDPVTSKDFIYSWTRTAKTNDAYASNLEPISGEPDVENGKATTIKGLSAPDDYTLVAKLDAPAGYWLTQLAMPTATEVLSKKAVDAGGEDGWWQNPATYIGAGPFKMTARTAKTSMDFEPVANWWGGSTGSLKKIHVDIGVSNSSAVKKFESNGYDIIGEANQSAPPDDVIRYKSDPAKSKLLTIAPPSRTTAVGFNFLIGPFRGSNVAAGADLASVAGKPTDASAGKPGRQAFSQSIDRAQLANIACAQGATCRPATGGYMPPGFQAYLGDNADPYSKFDAAAAKAALAKWDPDGSKVKGLQYEYNVTDINDAIAKNLQSQWKQNLGVTIDLKTVDSPGIKADRKAKKVIMGRESWGMDYNHPQDWLDNLSTCAQAKVGRGNYGGYCNPKVDDLATKANGLELTKAVPDYQSAFKLMVEDIQWANMLYESQVYLVQSYVSGAGGNNLYDYPWTGIKLLKH